jgi:RNA polymerase sigma factor (sigma-70 family)
VSATEPATATNAATDPDLVTGCLKGNEEAWVELWARYGAVVKAVARRAGCDADEAQDVLQRVALAALQGLDRLRDPEKLAGWLVGTARYQAFELIRRRRPAEQLFPSTAIHHPDPEGAIQLDRDLIVLRRALLALDGRCRRLIRSLDLSDPPGSYLDVARAEGLAPSSVGPIRRRCLNRLGKIMEKLSHAARSAHLSGEG